MNSSKLLAAALSLSTATLALAQEPAVPRAVPAATWTVFGMDSSAGVMIGLVLMLVFILSIVAVSQNERTIA